MLWCTLMLSYGHIMSWIFKTFLLPCSDQRHLGSRDTVSKAPFPCSIGCLTIFLTSALDCLNIRASFFKASHSAALLRRGQQGDVVCAKCHVLFKVKGAADLEKADFQPCLLCPCVGTLQPRKMVTTHLHIN